MKCKYNPKLSNSIVKITTWGLENAPVPDNPFAKSNYIDDGEPVIWHTDDKGRVVLKIRIIAEEYTYDDEGE